MAHIDTERDSSENGRGSSASTSANSDRRDAGPIPTVDEITKPINIKPHINFVFREPTVSELADIAFQWAASFVPTGRPETATHRQRAVTIGSPARFINRAFLLDALADSTRNILSRPDTKTVVATLPTVDEMLGWVCFSNRMIFYVYVVENARNTGLGAQLMKHISFLGPMPMACMTVSGAALLNSIQDKWWLK